jgi:hypothetical protein
VAARTRLGLFLDCSRPYEADLGLINMNHLTKPAMEGVMAVYVGARQTKESCHRITTNQHRHPVTNSLKSYQTSSIFFSGHAIESATSDMFNFKRNSNRNAEMAKGSNATAAAISRSQQEFDVRVTLDSSPYPQKTRQSITKQLKSTTPTARSSLNPMGI